VKEAKPHPLPGLIDNVAVLAIIEELVALLSLF
jgi:hypothetical protein